MIKAPMPSSHIIPQCLSGSLALGSDPLGDLYCTENSSGVRRDEGITLTPPPVVEWMVAHAQRRGKGVVRIVDGGAGTGRFTLAAAKAFPNAEIIAVEQNGTLSEILCRNVGALGLAKRVKIINGDFRDLALPRIEGRTLFIGNPPYVRHHDIEPAWKHWYQTQMAGLGVKASQLAGLHLHFFAKALSNAHAGDLVFFITAAEWLEVGYGKPLRDLILANTSIAEITLLDREAQVFDDAMTTSTLTLLEVGTLSDGISFRTADSIESLTHPNGFARFSFNECSRAKRWTDLLHPGANDIGFAGALELGELFRVHRGQVTGMNSVWVEGHYNNPLPAGVCFSAITRARDLLALPTARLRDAALLRRVIDIPEDFTAFPEHERVQISNFLKWAQTHDAHRGYIASHRKPWFHVNLRPPAPIVMTYMARRSPRFVRNVCEARLINVAHGLYPRIPIPMRLLDTLTDWLNANVSVHSGRTYSGGLTKFEPGEVMRLKIPSLDEIRILKAPG